MAKEYCAVLKHLEHDFQVIGRSESSAVDFSSTTGCPVHPGGIDVSIQRAGAPTTAIVAVSIDQLHAVTKRLILAGTRRVLLEKPGAVCLSELIDLSEMCSETGCEVFIGYNRRFYSAVKEAREFIRKDGGVTSVFFDFTERSNVISNLPISASIKERWLICNSSHVIDLVFHLCGKPSDWNHVALGALEWHPNSSIFCGAGITDRNVIFSYLSNWESPGRWGVELVTRERRLVFRPMEQLLVQSKGGGEDTVFSPAELDKKFKPGLLRQTENFIAGNTEHLCGLNEQVEHVKIYNKIAGYPDV